MSELMLDHKIAIKKKRKARIAAMIVLGIVAILAALIIVAACVPVNLKPSIVGTPDQITVYNQTSQHGQFSSDEDQYKTFMEKFDSMFETNYLVALFSGRLGEYEVHDSVSDQSSAYNNNFTISQLENTVLKSGYYVQFSYRQAQTLRKSNGDYCKSAYSSIPLTFTSMYFVINEKNSLETFVMYVPVKLYNSSEQSGSATTNEYVLKITQKANTSILYKSLKDFERM